MNMVEKVARVIFEQQRVAFYKLFDDIPIQSQEYFKDLACAAIEAMREPSEGMVKAAFNGPYFECAREKEIWDGYQAMIDAALKEDKL